MEIKAITRKWGSSLAVIIPKEVVKAKHIQEEEEIRVRIEKAKPKAGILYGYLKDWRKSGQELKDEARQEWEPASIRAKWLK